MPLQQISVSPVDWAKERTNSNQQKQKNFKVQDPVFMTSGLNPLERCPSQTSTLSNNNDICRICHCEGEEDAPLIAPCYCAGSLRYVHQACLQQWIKSSDIRSCELCKFQFVMQSKLKPLNKWESLEMNGVERRKLLCSVTFHAVALTCVVWSLYVLVDRTVEEIHRGLLEWPFWTKLVVVAIGFAGGVVFMYIQCKAYLHLCRRWRAFNRVIYVQNAPEKVALPPPAAIQPPKLVHQDSSYASETCCGVVALEGARMHRTPDATIVDMALANVHGKDAKIGLGSPLPTRSTNDRETGDCLRAESAPVKKQPAGGSSSLGDSKVIVATSSGTNYFTEAENINMALNLIDKLPAKDEYTFSDSRLLENIHSDNLVSGSGYEERSRLLDEGPSLDSDRTRILKSGGFQLLPSLTPPSTRQTSQSNDKFSNLVSPMCVSSSSSSEDSFKSLSIQLLQNQKPTSSSELAKVQPTNVRPWTSLNSCSNWTEKAPGSNPKQSARPKSSQGSQSPLLAIATVTNETK